MRYLGWLCWMVCLGFLSCEEFSDSQSTQLNSSSYIWIHNQNYDLPESIHQMGLYLVNNKVKTFGDLEIASGIIEYELDFPLYSDSLDKLRHLYLPPNTQLEVLDDESISYPDGTVFFKTFLRNHHGVRKPVETRVLYYQDLQWKNKTYQWNEDGTDAILMNGRGAQLEFHHNGRLVEYDIPNKLECNNCHHHSKGHILGMKQLQFSREPGGNNDELYSKISGLLKAEKNWGELCVDSLSGVEKEAVGYIQGNCAHCHSEGHVTFQTTQLDLSPCGLKERISHLAPSIYPESDQEMKILHPGKPNKSLIYILMDAQAADFRTPMPPIGVKQTHHEGRELIAKWIADL